MNITRLNFPQALPLIKQTIARSHFLAFDLEMSGIMTEQVTSPSIVDSAQRRYEKQRQSIYRFIPLQFGLSLFQVLPQQNKQIINQSRIIAYPFNFYIFPVTQPNEPFKFSFHAGTMNFLTSNQFDFNKLFYEGIPYTSEEKLQIFKRQNSFSAFQGQLKRLRQVQSPEVKAFIKLNMPLVEEWLSSQKSELEIDIRHVKYLSYMIFKEKIEEKHAEKGLSFGFDGDARKRSKMVIRKEKEVKSEGNNNQQELLFNYLFKEIIESKKPMIVHNGFLDLMHVILKRIQIFLRFQQSLPNTWIEYKRKIHALFPHLYDNKYLFTNSPTLNSMTQQNQTGLQNCFVSMRQLVKKEEETGKDSVRIEIAEEMKEYSLDSLECHQAGFDSLMTGYSFLKGVTHLNNNIDILTDLKSFNQQHFLIRNRVSNVTMKIPQGSIKVPFNLQENDEDIYTKDGNPPIYFRSYLNQTLDQQNIVDFFSTNYGSVNLIWTKRDLTEFCIIFLSQEVKGRFQAHLHNNYRLGETTIFKIDIVEWLVLSEEKHQSMMRNAIAIDQRELDE